MEEIKVGDVVKLKSGGPNMTVENIGSYAAFENGANCVWFTKDGHHEKVFELSSLVLE